MVSIPTLCSQVPSEQFVMNIISHLRFFDQLPVTTSMLCPAKKTQKLSVEVNTLHCFLFIETYFRVTHCNSKVMWHKDNGDTCDFPLPKG